MWLAAGIGLLTGLVVLLLTVALYAGAAVTVWLLWASLTGQL